ncbi:MAG: flagellar biosynthetic protein FliO [Acidimicrobiales bacterium]|nr:flagellar biosynthetic protein FliO [Acidimicrobiales bacterium]
MTMVGILVTLGKAGIVFGLLAVTVKLLRRYDRRVGTGPRRPGPARGGRGHRRRDRRVLDVVERTTLSRTASMILVRVQDQHWVLGVTDQQVTMLLEVDLPEEADAIDLRARHTGRSAPEGNAPEGAGDDAAAAPERFSALLRSELLRQTRRYRPGRSRVEVLDPPAVTGDTEVAP